MFNKPHQSTDQVALAGEKFILALYGGIQCGSLDEHRYFSCKALIARQSLTANFNLAIVPPTAGAARQHSMRTYLQVQTWLGNELSPCDWGWHLRSGQLIPVTTQMAVAPDELLNILTCSCKAGGCQVSCSCRQVGMQCSDICKHCKGRTCSNAVIIESDSDSDTDIV